MVSAYTGEETRPHSAGYFMKMRRLVADSHCQSAEENNIAPLSQLCDQLRLSWRETAFSPMEDHSLKRYFSFQLESIRDILDTFPFGEQSDPTGLIQKEFIGLINYLFLYFKTFLDSDLISPFIYSRYKLSSLDDIAGDLINKLTQAAIDDQLGNIIQGYICEMTRNDPNIHDTYHALDYFEKFNEELNLLDLDSNDADKLLVLKLTELNFNHIGFLSYLRSKMIREISGMEKYEALEYLEAEKFSLRPFPCAGLCYDKRLPGIKQILYEMIADEIQRIKALPEAEMPAGKLNVGFSVAHLALLIRLFFEAGYFPKSTLTAIFKFFSHCYSTKRQPAISAASLSKEYYSINQVTAAVVRDMLQKMIARINRSFFPVWAAAGMSILCALGNR